MSDWEPADELRGLLYSKLSALAPNDGVGEWELVDDTVDAIMREWTVVRETVRRKTDMQPLCRLVIALPWCPVSTGSQSNNQEGTE